MSLRISLAAAPPPLPTAYTAHNLPAPPADDWTSRLAKLIPAEALALYGVGLSLATNLAAMAMLAAASIFVSGAVRYLATRDASGKPQWAAILIAVVSFLLWLAALPVGSTPIRLGDEYRPLASIAALCWSTIVPIFYKGDTVAAQ